jgi:aldose 1-epimerase
MKKILVLVAVIFAAISCKSSQEVALFPASDFDATVGGKQVSLYTLKAGDVYMQVTNFGARVVGLWTPDKTGKYEDIVLGYKNIDTYLNNPGERFLGSVVGPYANRIANGKFTLDGVDYQLDLNNNGHTLHGGNVGLDMVVWDVLEATDTKLVLAYTDPDMAEGFPGNLTIKMTYSLNEKNEFRVDYEAVTDKARPVNLSHHSFFNLKGEGNGTILDNILYLNASHTTPVDSFLIPTGEIASVEGTPFDFRKAHAIGDMIEQENQQLEFGLGYDHNWILDTAAEGLTLAASLYEPASGRSMEVLTDQPAIQFYCGNFFDGKSEGKYNKALKYRESVALETQKYPDSPNHENFPTTILRPGETYTHVCVYRFSVK